MANSRRRLSFVNFAQPEVWHKLVEYSEVTITMTKLITDFTDQWAKICTLASEQLQQLVIDFRQRTETDIREKCHLGGMMYDLWESLLLESEIESQSLKKVASVMETQISNSLGYFRTQKTLQLNVNKTHRADLEEIISKSQEIVRETQEDYFKIYDQHGVSPEYYLAHNEYLLELTGINSLYSKYEINILPHLLQGMEESQLEAIDTICQTIQLLASLLQEYHEQRQSSFASFVLTSTSTNPNEELENYICSMDNTTKSSSSATAVDSPIQIQFQSFLSPLNHTTNSTCSQLLSPTTNEQLIIYAAPVIQMQLSSRCKETIDRLKDIKKEKSLLLAIINPQTSKIPLKQRDDLSTPFSKRKILNQINELMKSKHQLRLIELEESVLLAQQDLLKSRRPSMASIPDNEHDGQKRASTNIKGLWRDAFRALKTSTLTSGTGDDENRSSMRRK